MAEVFTHPQHVRQWHAAARGELPSWAQLFEGYRASVDWPGAAFWREISAAFPQAIVLLSHRDAASWWRSAHATIFPAIQRTQGEWRAMMDDLFTNRFTNALGDEVASIAAFERHNADVRRSVPKSRLLEWQPSDGWAPLCAALEVAVPNEPFPRVNTTADFLGAHGPT